MSMADEPRRSVRATKGQHTKNDDEILLPPASNKPSNKSSKKISQKASAEPSDNDDGEDDSIIRCVCGATADEEGWPMICCDRCEAWQHNLCMGISEKDEELPEKYYCEVCKPAAHKELLGAMKRGEKPWEARKAERVEEERRKRQKKGKGGRKSGVSAAGTPAKGTPVPVETNKRKFEETPQVVKKSASPAVVVTPSLARRKSSAQIVVPDAKRRKSTVDTAHSRKSSVVLPPLPNYEDLPADRQKANKAISGKAKVVIDGFAKAGEYSIPEGETANSLAADIALQIENALSAIYTDSAAYKQQFMAILANIPRNTQLILQVLTGNLTAIEIAEMSSDDMASEDVQRERAKAKEEADKQSILISESGPRMRKTHKGEELVGGDDRIGTSDDASWATRNVRRDTQDESMPDADQEEHDAEDRAELPDDPDNRHPPPLSVDTKRKASSAYNIDRAWGAAHSPNQATYPRASAPTPTRRQGDTQMHDADIDRLLNDEDDEVAPPSPLIDGAPGAPIWKGRVDMAGVASFTGSARWVAGGDVGQKIPYTQLLPSKLDITGRIAVARADEYVAGMRFSNTNDVCCLNVTPRRVVGDEAEFGKIWRYFDEKGRWGVLDPKGLGEGTVVRDAYLVTLAAGEGGIPDFLGMLENKSVPEVRERDMLILTLVVKTKSPLSTPAPQLSATPVLPQASPALPQAFGLPPAQGGRFNGNGNGNGTAPGVTQQEEYPWATDVVKSILGPEINAPAVVQLMAVVPQMSEEQLRNLRAALEANPTARGDLCMLGVVLRGAQEQQ